MLMMDYDRLLRNESTLESANPQRIGSG